MNSQISLLKHPPIHVATGKPQGIQNYFRGWPSGQPWNVLFYLSKTITAEGDAYRP